MFMTPVLRENHRVGVSRKDSAKKLELGIDVLFSITALKYATIHNLAHITKLLHTLSKILHSHMLNVLYLILTCHALTLPRS